MDLVTGIISGFLATATMDLIGISVSRKKIIDLKGVFIVPALLGRWMINIIKSRKIFFADIRLLQAEKNEAPLGFAAHYLIGILLGVGFVLASSYFAVFSTSIILSGFLFGLLTNVFPWLVMYPAMGFGLFAHKLSIRNQLLGFSNINHMAYGLALGVVTELLLI